MTKVKKIVTSCIAALGVFGSLCANASAATQVYEYKWSATGRKIPGAPTSVNSEPDYCSIWQKKDEAEAITLSISHTVAGSEATIVIKCRNYTMPEVRFSDYDHDWKSLYPNVGNPTENIEVKYMISVSTDTTSDSATSTGKISKK